MTSERRVRDVQAIESANDSIGRRIQRVVGIWRVRITESGQAQGNNVKSIGKARRYVVENMCVGVPSMQQHERRADTAPIEVLKSMTRGAYKPNMMGRFIMPFRSGSIGPLRRAYRRSGDEENANKDAKSHRVPMC